MNTQNPLLPQDANPATDICYIIPQEYVHHVRPFDWVARSVPEEGLKLLGEKPLPPGHVLLLYRAESVMGLKGVRLVFRRVALQAGMNVTVMTTDLINRLAECMVKEEKK